MNPEQYYNVQSLLEYLEHPKGLYILDEPRLMLELCDIVKDVDAWPETYIFRYVNNSYRAVLFYFAPSKGYLYPY